jgi:D-glycero-D-manno-heptose 1,7-bisphosphate phosphatase
MNKAVFYDRDGTIMKMIYDPDEGIIQTAKKPSQINFVPGIIDIIKHTTSLGYKNIIASNQAGVGAQKISLKNFNNVKNEMTQLITKQGAIIDAQYYCFHHPSATIQKYKKDCDCRKPKPGLLIQASLEHNIDLNKSWIIGDSINDVLAGNSVGCKTILLANLDESEYLHVLEENLKGIKPNYLIKNLEEAINIIKI